MSDSEVGSDANAVALDVDEARSSENAGCRNAPSDHETRPEVGSRESHVPGPRGSLFPNVAARRRCSSRIECVYQGCRTGSARANLDAVAVVPDCSIVRSSKKMDCRNVACDKEA